MDPKKQKDISDFFDQLKDDPEIKSALFNPIFIDNSIEKLQKLNEAMIMPLLICDNPDSELPKIPPQLNFKVPLKLKRSKEPYVINIKNDLNMYRKLYEKHSKQVNKIIEKTKESIKNLYQPLKKLRDDIKINSNDFENCVKQTYIPLQNKKEGINKIDYKIYPKDKQKKFIFDKNDIIQEINDYLNEANDFYSNYERINKNTLLEIENVVQQFMNLAKPAKELTTFMRKFFKIFEKSASDFNDVTDKTKIDNAFQRIKEPINEFYERVKNTKLLLNKVENIEKENKIENINEIIKKNKEKIVFLKEKSDNISKKIFQIREKYGEKLEVIQELKLLESNPVNILEATQKIDKEKKEIDQETEKKIDDLKKDTYDIIKQSRLDLLFIMDITNSMDSYLNQAKTGILDMIKKIQIECAGIEIFLGFIAYKDFNDLDFGENYINLEFTKDYDSIINNIKFLIAEGGGDTPEDLCGAFDLAKNKNWTGKSRFAILVTDSPCHGTKYHDLKGEQEDNFPDGDREGRNIEEYIQFFAKNEISLYCLKINSTTDKMFNIFKDIYEKNKNKDSKNEFYVQQGEKIFNIVTENAVKTFQNRKNLEIKE